MNNNPPLPLLPINTDILASSLGMQNQFPGQINNPTVNYEQMPRPNSNSMNFNNMNGSLPINTDILASGLGMQNQFSGQVRNSSNY
jgi:hypothetical protein